MDKLNKLKFGLARFFWWKLNRTILLAENLLPPCERGTALFYIKMMTMTIRLDFYFRAVEAFPEPPPFDFDAAEKKYIEAKKLYEDAATTAKNRRRQYTVFKWKVDRSGKTVCKKETLIYGWNKLETN